MADRQASSEERDNALFDELTGVYTRAAGLIQLDQEIARSSRSRDPLVIAFVDVDRLKMINDSRGHAAGDQLLREVANCLRSRLRSYDLIFRYGGDEFVCVIPGMDAEFATVRLAEVCSALTAFDDQWKITAGITQLQLKDTLAQVLERADAALYDTRRAVR
jgi:diguanylate cyclase (GGDEF)-like protein